MKKLLASILSIAILFSLASCTRKAEMFCYSCGEALSKEDAFCSACGASMEGIAKKIKNGTDTSVTTTQATTTHTHSYTQKVTANTCTEKGFTTYTCECGDSYTDDYVDAAHDYSDYVCTRCKAIDKSHAYNYLKIWMIKNCPKSGVSYSMGYEDGGTVFTLTYNAEDDLIYAKLKDDSSIFILDISDPNKNFEYALNVHDGEYEAYGKVNAKTFTDDSVVTCRTYEGYSGDKDKILKMATLSVCCIPPLLNMVFGFADIDLTYQDIGFEKY